MMPMLLAAALAAQVLPSPTAIANWQPAGEDEQARYAFDPASVRRDGDIARLVIRAVAHRTEASGMRSAVVRYRIDCRAATIGIEALDAYDENGRYLSSREVGPAEMRVFPVSSYEVYRTYYRHGCERLAPAE